MSVKTDKAIARMADEIKGKDYLVPFEEYLTGICVADAVAEKIMEKGKSLQGAFEAMRDIAKKRQVQGCAYIPPEEGFEIIRNYYGIRDADMKQAAPAAGTVNVLDLL